MVRVISVHHFASQHIQTVEQPTACTVAAPDRLLLALTNNCIEVRDLQNESDLMFTFPSVDEVIQIVHCLNGDYVATLETKFNRQNKDINFVRVYVNWDSVAALQQSKMTSGGVTLGATECGMVQPMRARIAGRVTPTVNQSDLGSLEMIEVPVKRNPNFIACDQTSGNLLVLADTTVNVYPFKIRQLSVSKKKYVDFLELPVTLEMNFSPTQMAICENYIAVMNKDSMHLFRINCNEPKEKDTNTSDIPKITRNFTNPPEEPLDYEKLLKDEMVSVVGNKTRITVNLPSIVRDNSIIHKHSPFTFTDKEMIATVHGPILEVQKYEIENLIQLRLHPILVESAQRQVTEEFKCMILKPLFIVEDDVSPDNPLGIHNRFFRSDYRRAMIGITCMITTQQEGYLYYFNDTDNMDTDHCIAVYPFTAPVQKLVMEDYFLHALTETGLESYTLRFAHELSRQFEVVDNINVACPSISDSICLVGLRPFLGVEQLLLSDHHLVLLANSDSSPTHSVSSNSSSNAAYWTLYNLELPTPKTIFNDFSIVAHVHRFTSAQTYCHLMSEAHMVLRTVLMLRRWGVTESIAGLKLLMPLKVNVDDIIEIYRTSCALLADHFIMCSNPDDYRLAIPYYRMARVTPSEVLTRVKKVQEQSNNKNTRGVVNYLKTVLTEVRHSWEVDKIISPNMKQYFLETVLDLMEKHNYEDLPDLILKSVVWREFSTDKLIHILTERFTENNSSKRVEKLLALSLLYSQKWDQQSEVKHCLQRLEPDELKTVLKRNWVLLFDCSRIFIDHLPLKVLKVTTFSEFAVLMMSCRADVLSEVLVNLVNDEHNKMTLCKLVKVFLEYLPSSIGSDAHTASTFLQKTLELYFCQYFAKGGTDDLKNVTYERGAQEALQFLIRSYLSKLKIVQIKEELNRRDEITLSKIESEIMGENDEKQLQDSISKSSYFEQKPADKKPEETYLFSHLRHAYLDKMPPFQLEITAKLYEASGVEDPFGKEKNSDNNDDIGASEEIDLVVKKLQAILCSGIVPEHVIQEVRSVVAPNNERLRGKLALKSILAGNDEAVLLLLNVCPQCVLQFAKDRFVKLDEWEYLIGGLQVRILQLSEDEDLKRIHFFYRKILKDVLTYVATSMTLDQLMEVLPKHLTVTTDGDNRFRIEPVAAVEEATARNSPGTAERQDDTLREIQDYEPYVQLCKETMQANKIHELIVTTGHQLLCTLNL